MRDLRVIVLAVLTSSFFQVKSQSVINAYAKVTNIAGTSLSLSNVNETNDTFEAGERVIVMQMQGDIIGANTNNDANFGNISAIGSVGLYEDAIIQSVNESLGAVEDIWYETFEDLAVNAQTDAGATSWTIACQGATPCGIASPGANNNYFQVRSDFLLNGTRTFVGEGVTNPAKWSSGVINISGVQNLTVSINLGQENYDDASDYVRAYYSINGGVETLLTNGNQSGAFTNVTATASGISGNTLQLHIYVMNDANNDRGKFDNIRVQGQKYYPNSITLASSLINTYSIGTNTSVQIISFPRFTNYTTTSNLTALAWDGNIGGVFALDVTNTLTLAHNISVNAQGFRGGIPNPTGDGSGCSSTVYITNSNNHARKGEGIYKVTNTNYQAGRAKVTNGGGGGSFHNAGGGGGGNFTVGGDGGPGWDGSTTGCSPSGGGLGGLDLSSYIGASRVFMGGGGGGGQQNNNVATTGGTGGGVILIRASTVQTNGGCGGLSITANGANIALAGNDGGGGAGAGGAIVFQVNTWNLACQLTTEARGGNGGSVNSGAAHGGGGGGGKGVIIFSGTVPATNFTASNSQGTGGANGTNPASGNAVAGGTNPTSPSADPDGIVESSSGVLPVELLNWKAKEVNNHVLLTWATASETNNHFFTIEKSTDAKNWNILATVEGAGTTENKQYYDLIDENLSAALVYYRLSQTDYDGTTEVFDVVSVKISVFSANLLLYPNPNTGNFRIKLPDMLASQEISVAIFDAKGRQLLADVRQEWGEVVVEGNSLPTGYYFVKVSFGSQQQSIKMIVD